MQKHLTKQKIIRLLENEFREQINPLLKLLSGKKRPHIEFVNTILEISQQLQRSEDIIYLLRSAIQQAPRACPLYSRLIGYLLQQNKYQQAEWWWGISLKIEPQCADLWLFGVEIALWKENETEAVNCLNRASSLFHSKDDDKFKRVKASLNLWRAEKAWKNDECERALFWARSALVDDSSWDKPHHRLNEMLRLLKQSQPPSSSSILQAL